MLLLWDLNNINVGLPMAERCTRGPTPTALEKFTCRYIHSFESVLAAQALPESVLAAQALPESVSPPTMRYVVLAIVLHSTSV